LVLNESAFLWLDLFNLDYWYGRDFILENYLNENNVWLLINYSVKKLENFENQGRKSFHDGVKFSDLFTILINYVFVQYKKQSIESEEFSNIIESLKNTHFLKIFFNVMIKIIKDQDNLVDNYNFSLGACFDVSYFKSFFKFFKFFKLLTEKYFIVIHSDF
jgi:hypothetical protein